MILRTDAGFGSDANINHVLTEHWQVVTKNKGGRRPQAFARQIVSTDWVDLGHERPFYIGPAQTLTAPATILAPLIGGWVADSFGFVPAFAISTVLSVVMILILWLIVKDPRKAGSQSTPKGDPAPQQEIP